VVLQGVIIFHFNQRYLGHDFVFAIGFATGLLLIVLNLLGSVHLFGLA
jgi:hypothetical protein